MSKFKVGDNVVGVERAVRDEVKPHQWLVKDKIYKIHLVDGNLVYVQTQQNEPIGWWSEDWFKLYEGKETEMALTSNMNAKQIRNEILRIRVRIEEAKKDIENAEKERDSLVEKLREKGFELTHHAPTNSHSQKLAVGDIVRILSYNEEYHPENYTNHSAEVIKTDSSCRPYLVEVGGREFWCTPEEVEKI